MQAAKYGSYTFSHCSDTKCSGIIPIKHSNLNTAAMAKMAPIIVLSFITHKNQIVLFCYIHTLFSVRKDGCKITAPRSPAI